MGVGAPNFVSNAYEIYKKPEINIPLNVAKITYNSYKIYKYLTHKTCIICKELYKGYDGDGNMCKNCKESFKNWLSE